MAYQHYYLNKNQQEDSGDYEVHIQSCSHGAHPSNQIYLGYYNNCADAVNKAIRLYGHEVKKYHGRINGCFFCCRPCHTS